MKGNYQTQARIGILAPIEKVWEALTTPELIMQWFFGAESRTEWRPGGPIAPILPILNKRRRQGEAYEDKGRILKVEPPNLLVHTHWSRLSGRPDNAGNYQQVAWSLVPWADGPAGGPEDPGAGTELTVLETNIPDERAMELSEQTWNSVLEGLKALLERETVAAS
jgi:uncharacterized protein YndB with AHSA1/START domain